MTKRDDEAIKARLAKPARNWRLVSKRFPMFWASVSKAQIGNYVHEDTTAAIVAGVQEASA